MTVWLLLLAWFVFNVYLAIHMVERSKKRMPVKPPSQPTPPQKPRESWNVCGNQHMGPVDIVGGGFPKCRHCKEVLTAREIVDHNRTRKAALDVMAKALRAAPKTR